MGEGGLWPVVGKALDCLMLPASLPVCVSGESSLSSWDSLALSIVAEREMWAHTRCLVGAIDICLLVRATTSLLLSWGVVLV